MHQAVSKIVDEFRRRTPGSAALAKQAAGVFPSGVTHDGRYLQPYPVFIERAAGTHKWDVDGHEYVDYSGGHGALLLGHNHPPVVAAVAEQLQRGTHYGSCHELEVRWGQLVQKLLPSAQRVRFTSSGTEATLLALRLARAFTDKKKIVRFLGHFHGWHDHVAFGVNNHFEGTPSPGVLPEVTENMLLAMPNDTAAITELLSNRDDIAAVMIEPTGASWGQVPVQPEFLHALRQQTSKRGALLIFDEVITGFRVSPGGAQGEFGIQPDLTTLAKIVAGGLPGGAVAGRADILHALDFAVASQPGREKVPHQGTFNANPLSAAAGIATLSIVAETDVCQRANDYAARLREALAREVRDAGLPWCVYGSFSGFHIFTNPQGLAMTAAQVEAGEYDHRTLKSARAALTMKLRIGMLLHGVEIFGWPGGPTSAMHSTDDLEQTVQAFRGTLRMLQAEGEI
ncbi:MAG: aspartate aminotransferase family protein [Pirellulales bacterium]